MKKIVPCMDTVLEAPAWHLLMPELNNLHNIAAGCEGLCFFDVISPPYSTEKNRQCGFYEATVEG